MPSLRIEMNDAGVRELLKSDEVKDELRRRAEQIAAAAGDGFGVQENETTQRARAVVVTETEDAMLAEARNRTLTRAVEAGRG